MKRMINTIEMWIYMSEILVNEEAMGIWRKSKKWYTDTTIMYSRVQYILLNEVWLMMMMMMFTLVTK